MNVGDFQRSKVNRRTHTYKGWDLLPAAGKGWHLSPADSPVLDMRWATSPTLAAARRDIDDWLDMAACLDAEGQKIIAETEQNKGG